MKLSFKQVGVLKGMAVSMGVTISVITLGILFDPFSFTEIIEVKAKLFVLGCSLILPTFFLVISIGRLAKHRFFSPDDIDGSALTKGTEQATLLQSLLQNTLEQLTITAGVYSIWCFTMPAGWLSVLPLCSFLFATGRIAFYLGYKNGAPSRAFGFALTFYPTVLLLLLIMTYHAIKLIN